MKKLLFPLGAALVSLVVACGGPPPAATPQASGPPAVADSPLPHQLEGKAVVLAAEDPDAPRADRAGALKPAGEGGLTAPALMVRLTADVPVWRLWSGPTKKDADGRTNRLGQWWSYDAPHGSQQGYRNDYEVCVSWNDLTWVAQCTLKKGAVVAIGPGQSVSAKTCGDATGKESYPANPRDWQVWISKVWTRDSELSCPAETADYEADDADITQPKKAGAAATEGAVDRTPSAAAQGLASGTSSACAPSRVMTGSGSLSASTLEPATSLTASA